MPNSRNIVERALELLEGIGEPQARSMFGGHGLYVRGVMVGLIVEGELFLKTDELSRPEFIRAGCRPWIYTGRKSPMETSYYRPPDQALEDPESMRPWALLALESALRKQAMKKPATNKPPTKKRPAAAKQAPRSKRPRSSR